MSGVFDAKKPTPVCINGLSVELMSDGNGGGMVELQASAEGAVFTEEEFTGMLALAKDIAEGRKRDASESTTVPAEVYVDPSEFAANATAGG